MPLKNKEQWEEEFDKKFTDNFDFWREIEAETYYGDPNTKPIKDFIRSLLSAQKEEYIQELEDLKFEVSNMREPIPSANDHTEYNKGIKEGVEIIRNAVVEMFSYAITRIKEK